MVRRCCYAMVVIVVRCSPSLKFVQSLGMPFLIAGFHTFCLDPPLSAIPKGQWFCHTCLFGTGGDFGFDEGEEHSLSSFQARDLEFRKLWFESHPPPNSDVNLLRPNDPMVNRIGDVAISEYEVEDEFWRLVQSPNETVEIEYGADVHSTTHGRCVVSFNRAGLYG